MSIDFMFFAVTTLYLTYKAVTTFKSLLEVKVPTDELKNEFKDL